MKKWKKAPLLCCLAVSMLAVVVAALVGKWGIYKGYVPILKNDSAVAGFIEAVSDWNILQGGSQKQGPDDGGADPADIEQDATERMIAEAEETTETETEVPAEGEAEMPEEQSYEFTEVTREYFDDALFIGDSRTVGLKDYSGWDNATYYASVGLTIYDLFTEPVAERNGRKITIEQALSEEQFGKIYLMVGINEMGTGTIDTFMTAYEEAVQHLRELQPDALIFLEGIMYVKQSRSDRDQIFNNPAIQARNDRIAALANNRDIFYIDVNEVMLDETGNLNPEYTYDEVHLLGKYYYVWTDFLLQHGVEEEAQ
ncbi:MAG: acylhydrolase [Lachnospiraceae bacterium]|nr:acylhydrolase [Lachnospiraceae bacterium]